MRTDEAGELSVRTYPYRQEILTGSDDGLGRYARTRLCFRIPGRLVRTPNSTRFGDNHVCRVCSVWMYPEQRPTSDRQIGRLRSVSGFIESHRINLIPRGYLTVGILSCLGRRVAMLAVVFPQPSQPHEPKSPKLTIGTKEGCQHIHRPSSHPQAPFPGVMQCSRAQPSAQLCFLRYTADEQKVSPTHQFTCCSPDFTPLGHFFEF